MAETLIQGSGIVRKFSGTAPMFRADGTVLDISEIDSYLVYMTRPGLSPKGVRSLLVNGEFDYEFVVDANPINTYTFKITAVDTSGVEGLPSTEVVINVVAEVISPPNPPVVA